MQKYCLILFSLLLLVGQPMAFAAPQINLNQSKDFIYLVVAKDFTRHYVTLRYTGESWGDVYQTGSAAKGLKLKDTRECHWDFWNSYRMEHVKTTNASSGVTEDISDQLKLQQARDYPLYAPYVTELAWFGVEAGSWIGIDKLEKIFNKDDYKKVSTTMLVAPVDLVEASATLMGSMFARLTGLQAGVNCGDAKSAISASSKSYQDVMQVNMSVVPKAEFYLNSSNLYKYWNYRDPVSDQFVGALMVYPGKDFPDHLVASIKIWQEIRQNMLSSTKNNFKAPKPTEAEVQTFKDLITLEPDTWIETMIATYSQDIDSKFLDDMKKEIAPLTGTLELPLMPKSSEYVVVYQEFPAQLSEGYLNATASTRNKVDTCGHGGLYTVEFFDKKMSTPQKGNAEGMLARAAGNEMINFRVQTSRLVWISERLPLKHPLRTELMALTSKMLPQSATLRDLGNVYNPRNVAYRNCVGTH